jgi:predicted nucleic acid-binding Zn ribbon protein
MRCSECGSDNPEDKRFCGDRGSSLGNRCPKCGADNPPGKRFCGDCGSALSAPAAAIATLPQVRASGERRHLTVLFCDLVGSTAIAAQLDPEEWRDLVAAYHRAAAEAITRFGGYVAQYLGDGVMAYFGWPEAHDNDSERAARAGLAILDAIAKLNQHTPPPLPSPMSNNGGGDSRLKLVKPPEIYRIRGAIRRELEQPRLAEDDFREAIELAQSMGAKAWELRATISLARLLAKQGHRREAGARLGEIYGWFTEGFDTTDLKEAKALLDELAL